MVKVKICGIKTLQDVEIVNRQKPDFTGFVFYPLSKRYASLITARSLKAKLNKKIKSIGVFVNAPPEEIAAAAELGIINMVQLHGDETNAYIAELRKICTLPVRGQSTKNNARTRKGRKKTVANKKKATK